MPRPRKKADPFSVSLDAIAERDLINDLCDAIDGALSARAGVIGTGGRIDYAWWLYQQGRRNTSEKPWPDAADLGSYLVTEKVDALTARACKTIFVDPVWTVEGWGEAANRAPLVEEFHQWRLEEERLQQILGRVLLNAHVEGTGILEVYERAERRVQVRQERVTVALNAEGGVTFDEKGQPIPARDPAGNYVPALQPDVPAVDLVLRDPNTIRRGPAYRVLSLKDFLFLPGHAETTDAVWGYAKRFYRRVPELQRRADEGVYQNVADVGVEDEREQTTAQARSGQEIATQLGPAAEKELWEVLFLRDLDGDGLEEWYLATLSVKKRVLLRLQHDDLGQPRYVALTPIPRPDSVYGFSFVLDKLATITEEHTALRNMIADRSALATNAPIKKVQGALWDPQEQPWGPRAVIDVRDPRELEAMQVPDVPASAIERERSIIQAAERVSGLNDVALGTQPTESRTLGEVQLTTEQSFVRLEQMIRNVQEGLEDLWKLRHVLWIRALEEETDGLEAPTGLIRVLEVRQLNLPAGRITADMLRGPFRGKPRGSVENADLMRMRSDFNGLIQALAALAQVVPSVALFLQQPTAVRALFEQVLRVYKVPDRQAFLGPPGQVMPMPPPMGMLGPGSPMGATPPLGGAMPGAPAMAGAPMAGGPLAPPNPLMAALPQGRPQLM